MDKNPRILPPLAIALIAFAIGWNIPAHENRAPSTAEKRPPTPPARSTPPAISIGPAGLAEWSRRLADADARSRPELAAALAKSPSRRQLAPWLPLLARWSEVDGPGMLAFLETHAPPSLREKLLDSAWYAWGAADPDAAFDAGRRLSPGQLHHLLDGVAEADPRKAAEFALRSPDAQFMFPRIAGRIVGTDPQLADKLMKAAVYDGGRYPFQQAKIAQLAASDPTAAIAYARGLGTIGIDPVPATVAKIADLDPARAALEVAAMPSGRSKALSSVELAKTWATRDPDAAIAWVRELDDGPVRHYALVATAATSGHRDPQRALDLVMEAGRTSGGDFFSIRDSGSLTPYEQRLTPNADRTAADLLLRWSRQDPQAARRYLAENVPAEWRADLSAATGLEP